jgi:hypothetical protein
MNEPSQLDHERFSPESGESLPPVEAPSMALVTQLFLVPLVIVAAVVAVWLAVTWLASAGGNPEKYVQNLKKSGPAGWQAAASLAEMLRNPRNEKLKRDSTLAGQLAEVLKEQIDKGDTSEEAIKLRIFLVRTLGEFYVTDGLPVLIRAASTQRKPEEVVVRRTALEAIAVLADNTDAGPAALAGEPGLMPALLKAARERPQNEQEDAQQIGELRARAAFALGVLGTKPALDELELMLSDGFPNARYNAATGLARHGDQRGVRVLLQMLDPDNEQVVAGEEDPSAAAWKRQLVITNALTAVEKLAEKNPQADLGELNAAIDRLVTGPLDPLISGVRTSAKELQNRLRERETSY